jgi:N6-adenosine-specific RNA methylase IME4
MINFATITADPPWLERGAGKSIRGAQRHYPLLRTRDIPRVMMVAPEWRPAKHAHLYLWVTNNFLQDGLYVMSALGFRYVTNIAWLKGEERAEETSLQAGIGQYFRGAHELCLFGVRGSGLVQRTARRDIKSAFVARRDVHSRKPESFYELVEARSNGPYLECFARSGRPGWASWGNEAPRRAQRHTPATLFQTPTQEDLP